MNIRRINAGELSVGQALPWDVYGAGGGLLIRKGHVIANDSQLALLIERGMIGDDGEQTRRVRHAPPSALRMLNQACAGLGPALAALLQGQDGVRAMLEQAAALVLDAVALDPDVALACILHNQDAAPYPVRHGIDSAVVAVVVGRALKQPAPALQTLTLAALTMNAGMLGQHERLHLAGAAPEPADLAYIRAHPQAGAVLLRGAGIDDADWLACVLEHHENDDGSGYPHGLTAQQISAPAKILMLADRYCARISVRAYRKPLLANAALRELLLEAKETVDAQLVSVLIRELGIFPIGSYVRLLNGEIGVVSGKGLNSTTPYVHALIGPRGARLDVPMRRDTKHDLHAIREVLSAAQAGAAFRLEQLWGCAASL